MSDEVDRFIEGLCELELDPAVLRDDPGGERWLPRSLREMVEDDPACAREFVEFVDTELALLDVHEPCDAFFTRAVMDRLPDLEAIDDRRRNWILAAAYALAIGVTYLLLGPALSTGGVSEVSAWIEPLHDWYHEHAVDVGSLWVTLALVAMAALTALPVGPRRIDA